MAMNSLYNLANTLEYGLNEVTVPEDVRVEALRSVQRMVDFANESRVQVHGTGNA